MTNILLINPNTTKSITDLVLKTAKGFASKGTRLRALTGSFGPRYIASRAAYAIASHAALDAYAAHDVPAAMAVWKGDEEVDAICTSLFRELLTYMLEDPRNISFCIHLMFCAKNIERIGDHATNIAETVVYMVEGQPIMDKRPKADQITFAAAVNK